MPDAVQWCLYFQRNAETLLEIPWEIGAELTVRERTAIAASLQEFQAGERSEGHHLQLYADRYAEVTGDRAYAEAVRRFIAEEQRHARDLARFMALNGIATVHTTLGDSVFRWLRNVTGGLETSIAVLVTAEIVAKVYYAVLRQATWSVVLRRICEQILRDEHRHVAFQVGQLRLLRRGRWRPLMLATALLQRALFCGAVVAVWCGHRRVLARAGMPAGAWWDACWQEFGRAFAAPEVRNHRGVRPSSADA